MCDDSTTTVCRVWTIQDFKKHKLKIERSNEIQKNFKCKTVIQLLTEGRTDI